MNNKFQVNDRLSLYQKDYNSLVQHEKSIDVFVSIRITDRGRHADVRQTDQQAQR